MIKHFKEFFYPTPLVFSYKLSKESTVTRIREILAQKATFFSSYDMSGRFLDSERFIIETIPPGYSRGGNWGSKIICKIVSASDGTTQIITRAKPIAGYYFSFFVTISVGAVYLFQFFREGSFRFLLWSVAMLVFGPFLSIGLSNVGIASIRERYMMFIDKELRKTA